MHKIFVSEGIVLHKRGAGEANTTVSILTKNFGLLRATARSARFEKSKLRYGLEVFTHARFSFVRGKHEWKVIGVEKVSRDLFSSSASARAVAGRMTRLISRLVHGEEHGPALYASVREGFRFIARSHNTEEIEGAECVIVLQILSELGYIQKSPQLTPFIDYQLLSKELTAQALIVRPLLVRTINNSLAITGL